MRPLNSWLEKKGLLREALRCLWFITLSTSEVVAEQVPEVVGCGASGIPPGGESGSPLVLRAEVFAPSAKDTSADGLRRKVNYQASDP